MIQFKTITTITIEYTTQADDVQQLYEFDTQRAQLIHQHVQRIQAAIPTTVHITTQHHFADSTEPRPNPPPPRGHPTTSRDNRQVSPTEHD